MNFTNLLSIMQNPFNLFKRTIFPSCLGVDIGTTSIKMVEVKGGSARPRLVNYGILESSGYLARANQAFQTSTLKLFESEVVELLSALARKMGPGTKDVAASLPVFSVFTTVLDFPKMEESEIQKAIIYQAKQYVPLPLSEVALDWLKVGEFDDDKGFTHQKILLISVPQEAIKKYQGMFRAAGLNLISLEIESLSLARLLRGDSTPTIMVDIGSRSTNIVFFDNGGLVWNSQSDYGGASLTQALASSLGINPLRAEELKKERGVLGTGPSHELSTIMLPFLDVIINEVKKAQFVYQEQFPAAKKSERLVLAGGGANLLGIENYFEREFGVPTVKSSPFLNFEYPPEIVPLVPELNPVMSVALGLAMKQVS
jgi:type IV pilus assembly protein PilM